MVFCFCLLQPFQINSVIWVSRWTKKVIHDSARWHSQDLLLHCQICYPLHHWPTVLCHTQKAEITSQNQTCIPDYFLLTSVSPLLLIYASLSSSRKKDITCRTACSAAVKREVKPVWVIKSTSLVTHEETVYYQLPPAPATSWFFLYVNLKPFFKLVSLFPP